MQMVKKVLAFLLITACLLGAGITRAFAVTVGGTAYTHPVEVQNSTVWYNQNGDSRQIGGDAHTHNLIRRYEGEVLYRPLWTYQVEENRREGTGRILVSGKHIREGGISRRLKDTLLHRGAPQNIIEQFGKEEILS